LSLFCKVGGFRLGAGNPEFRDHFQFVPLHSRTKPLLR
jgi:hypothetical protein